VDLSPALVEQVLRTLGSTLAQRSAQVEIVAAGGSGLLLLGLASRVTRDVDVIALVEGGQYVKAAPLPLELAEAAEDVGRLYGLAADWLNPGPTSVLDFGLPEGFEQRVETRRFGGLTLHLASRLDQICLKLHAAVDQGPRSKHAVDLRRLLPTSDELLFAARWTLTQDASPAFRRVLIEALALFGVERADERL
jgi:hypothetical protein